MFKVKQFKILISKRILVLAALMLAITSVTPSFSYVKSAHAQSENDPNEYILEVLLLPQWRISEAIFAYELNGKYYLPIDELSDGFEFFSETDPSAQFSQGFASTQKNSFTIDGNRDELVIKGERSVLAEDAILQSDFLATDDLYVQLEVINSIWPVNMRIELSTLTVFADTEEELSFMRDRERKEKQKVAAARKETRERDQKKLPRRDNDYLWLGKPVVDLQTNYKYDADTDKITGSNIITGIQQLGKMHAEFSANLRAQDGNIQKPSSVRLKFSRRSAGEEYLWLPGLRKFEAGDVTLRQRDLIANSSTGRGVVISNDNQDRGTEFDRITVEGVGPPGWEIELYNNNELIDFSEVPDDGLFFFEDVILGYGNNEIRILFFGPQGQVKEEVRSYAAGGGMLKPNEFKYTAGLLDSERQFILLDNNPRTTPRGVAKSVGAAYGLNKAVTVFGNYSETPTIEGDRTYLTAGASLSTPVGLVEAEAYNQARGGNAFGLDYIAKFLGFRFNFNASFFNDFESEEAGFGSNKKKTEFDSQLSRSVKFFSVPIGLRFNALRTRRETGETTTDIDATQTITHSGIRLSHSARTSLVGDNHSRTSGSLTSTVREGPWQFRGGLNYSLFPDSKFVSTNGQVRYKTKNDFQSALSVSHNFDSSVYRVSGQLGYDFKKFLGTFESSFQRGRGWDFVVRTTTSLNPYTDNDRYTFTSASKRQSSPVRAQVFLDRDADGELDEGEEPLQNAKLSFGGGRSKDTTDENGYVIADVPFDKLINISLDSGSLEDPYFVSGYEGFSTVPIRGKMIDAVFPVIETGSIEGMAYRQSSNRFVPGLVIELVNQNGEVVQTVETGFDGFYVYEFVPPGTYFIRAERSHGVDLVDNSATVAVNDLYVYGNDIYINDMNVAFNEERLTDIAPAAGDGIYGPFEILGPHVPQIEMAGRHGDDGLYGLDQLAMASATVPKVVLREYAQKVPVQVSLPIQNAATEIASDLVSVQDLRFKIHNNKVRFVAELSDHIEYEILDSHQTHSVQILIRNAHMQDVKTLLAQQGNQIYSSKVEMRGNDVIVTISGSDAVQLKMSSILPAMDGGAGKRLMVDVQ